MPKNTIIFLVLVLFSSSVLAAPEQFKYWYKEYRHIFTKILRENCKEEHEFYLRGKTNETRFEEHDRWIGAFKSSQMVFPVANCILDASSEWMKVNMAGATVMLGLTPSMLTALGPSVEEVGMLSIIGQRPLLVMLLAGGAPALYPFRGIDYRGTITSLTNPGLDHLAIRPYRFSRSRQYLVMVFEVLAVGAAIYNNAVNSMELGRQTICSFSPQFWFLPTLWTFLGIFFHMSASWALWLRINCRGSPTTLLGWIKAQWTPLAEQPALEFELTKETIFSTLVAWGFTVSVGGYIVFGTVTFSSLVFITVSDAVAVIGRYLASLLVCRLVLMYELSILRDNYRQEQVQHKPISERAGFKLPVSSRCADKSDQTKSQHNLQVLSKNISSNTSKA
ncbi:hypothetical protein GQ44DRAFT_825814 [Phaeosphaeriaceae sp. PMI808]|nr:hypothetical protein GQ44DRAFT_825814 [Phaeosphaeriaceae sp. PMI808]